MKTRIGKELLDRLAKEPTPDKPREFYDDALKGFTLRQQPNGSGAYLVRYRTAGHRQTRVTIGRLGVMGITEARSTARDFLLKIHAEKFDPAAVHKQERALARIEPTLRELIENLYIPIKQRELATARRTGKMLLSILGEDLLARKLRRVDAHAVNAWRVKRLEGGTVTPFTVNKNVAQLSAVLSFAVEQKLLSENPLAGLKRLRQVDNKRVKYLTDDEEASLRRALDEREDALRARRESANANRAKHGQPLLPAYGGDHLKPLVLLAINTGMRRGELFGLRWRDVGLAGRRITITAANAKSGTARHIPLNSEALDVLTAWRARAGDAPADSLVFPGREGRELDGVRGAWEDVLKRARIEGGSHGFRWHDLRHHFASRLVMAGVDLNRVRELMGHATMAMTLRYAHLAPSHVADAVERIVRADRRPAEVVGLAEEREKRKIA
jgi:integrase